MKVGGRGCSWYAFEIVSSDWSGRNLTVPGPVIFTKCAPFDNKNVSSMHSIRAVGVVAVLHTQRAKIPE